MALNTAVTESQVGEIHRLMQQVQDQITGILAQIPPTDGLYTGFTTMNTNIGTMLDTLKRGQARLVLERLQKQDAELHTEIAAQQAIIAAP